MRKVSKLLVFILIVTLILPNVALAKDTEKVAKILELSGDVQVKKGGGEKLFKAFKNMALTQGDTIITGKDGKVTIELDKDKEVVIGSDTQLLISELVSSIKAESGKTSLNLLGGKVKVSIKEKLKGDSKFEIKTPTSVMGVRGTSFYINVNRETGATYVAVFEGVVSATAVSGTDDTTGGDPVLIEANQQTQITEEGASEPEPINVEQMDSFGLEQYIEEMMNNEETDESFEELLALLEQKRAEEEDQRQQREEQQQENQRNRPQVNYDAPTSTEPDENNGPPVDPGTGGQVPAPEPDNGYPTIKGEVKVEWIEDEHYEGYVVTIPFVSSIELDYNALQILIARDGVAFTEKVYLDQIYMDETDPTKLNIQFGHLFGKENVLKILPGGIRHAGTGNTNPEALFTGFFGTENEHGDIYPYMSLYWEEEEGYQVLPFVPRYKGLASLSYRYAFFDFNEEEWKEVGPIEIDEAYYTFNAANGELKISNEYVRYLVNQLKEMNDFDLYIVLKFNEDESTYDHWVRIHLVYEDVEPEPPSDPSLEPEIDVDLEVEVQRLDEQYYLIKVPFTKEIEIVDIYPLKLSLNGYQFTQTISTNKDSSDYYAYVAEEDKTILNVIIDKQFLSKERNMLKINSGKIKYLDNNTLLDKPLFTQFFSVEDGTGYSNMISTSWNGSETGGFVVPVVPFIDVKIIGYRYTEDSVDKFVQLSDETGDYYSYLPSTGELLINNTLLKEVDDYLDKELKLEIVFFDKWYRQFTYIVDLKVHKSS